MVTLYITKIYQAETDVVAESEEGVGTRLYKRSAKRQGQ